MVNFVLSFCKITGASRIFSRNFYLPLLKPLTPKDALRTLRITGKWLLGAKIQHYIPVLMNHKKKRSRRVKNYGLKTHEPDDNYTYMTPVIDADNENHKLLLTILNNKKGNGVFVYTVEDKKYNIVLQAQLERAILDGDIIDILVSQKNDKIIVKLKSLKKIPLEIQYYENNNADMYCGEGTTTADEEKFHHHGKYTMGLAKMFEDKELMEEKWEEELRKIMKRRKRQAKEGSKEWKEMMKETMKNLDWNKFEEEAQKIIKEIDEPATEDVIDMDIEDLEATKGVNETFLKHGPDLLNKLPTLKEIPDIIKSMGNATLLEIETDDGTEAATNKRRVSGVNVKLSSGKECFVSGQMVHTNDGDVFVPGQTIENEFGLEYAPGITINVDNKPTLINGLIMGEDEKAPMFLPTQSTITADGQLTFATTPEERPKTDPEKVKNKKAKTNETQEANEESQEAELMIIIEETESSEDEKSSSEIEEFDADAIRLKQEQEKLEMDRLKQILLDDGLDDIIASIEDKRAKLKQKLEELRKLSVNTEKNLVSYVGDNDAIEVASKISENEEVIHRLSDILMTVTRRAATFRDKNSVHADNINQANIFVSNPTEADVKFNNSSSKLKMLLKTAVVAQNDVFKHRPKDQILALNALEDILIDLLKNDERTIEELLNLMNTPVERMDMCNAIFKQLTQNITETKVSVLNHIAKANLSSGDVVDYVEKILRKESETKCDAFVKVAKIRPSLTNLLIENIKTKIKNVRSDEAALELLNNSIETSVTSLIDNDLKELFEDEQDDLSNLRDEALSFAKALGVIRAEEILEQSTDISRIHDKSTLELLERVVLMRHLSERDFSLRSAIERMKKNHERSRNDPRIRQLVRESALLLPKGDPVRTSRDVPLQLMKSENILAIEDFLIKRSQTDFPVLVSRNSLQVVIPKEAARGVLTGKISYALIDEGGVTNFKPMHMFGAGNANKNREKRTNDYSSEIGRDRSVERDNDRNYRQAKSNGSDGSWSSPRNQRAMSSGSLYRGYTGPRA